MIPIDVQAPLDLEGGLWRGGTVTSMPEKITQFPNVLALN